MSEEVFPQEVESSVCRSSKTGNCRKIREPRHTFPKHIFTNPVAFASDLAKRSAPFWKLLLSTNFAEVMAEILKLSGVEVAGSQELAL